jgi:hypothetical protein
MGQNLLDIITIVGGITIHSPAMTTGTVVPFRSQGFDYPYDFPGSKLHRIFNADKAHVGGVLPEKNLGFHRRDGRLVDPFQSHSPVHMKHSQIPNHGLPSGKLLHNYGKSPFSM